MQAIPPRVAAIHDLSGFGRTSLTVVIPILSSMGIQVCPLPTAILSTHTVDFTDFTLLDLTQEMPHILDHWEALGLQFDAVYSGFMASCEQMALVERCIRTCLKDGGLSLIDPVLGDNGILDPTMTPDMVKAMQKLIAKANITTPNFTELAFLLGEPVPKSLPIETVKQWLRRVADMGPRMVVATSVPTTLKHKGEGTTSTSVVAFDKEQGHFWHIACQYIPAHYPGTGDSFSSVLVGALLQGDALPIAIERAVDFVSKAIRATFEHQLPTREGILLEQILPNLATNLHIKACSLLP